MSYDVGLTLDHEELENGRANISCKFVIKDEGKDFYSLSISYFDLPQKGVDKLNEVFEALRNTLGDKAKPIITLTAPNVDYQDVLILQNTMANAGVELAQMGVDLAEEKGRPLDRMKKTTKRPSKKF
jgi:hypothetical protein